ncbi:MAG TPA: fumarate hydratase [Clostridiales bacterium]|nr:fumarate hydratase [Clostridiales bacterium]
MNELTKEQLKAAVKAVWIRSLTEIQPDVINALRRAREAETNRRAQQYLDIIIENALTATEKHTVICQDTGVPTFFIKTSLGFPYGGSLREAFDEAMHEMTMGEFPMRPMVVDPLTREDLCDNTGVNVPLLHIEIEEGLDYMEIKAAPKGAGSGFWGTLTFLPPSAGVAGVKKFVVDSVLRAGSNPCPPLIVGVGIGGPIEEVARLATVASLRPIDKPNPRADLAALETELRDALNMSKIGAMGVGGDTTVIGVNIETSGSHKPWLPVAVNVNCWPGRKASCRVYADGRVEQLQG